MITSSERGRVSRTAAVRVAFLAARLDLGWTFTAILLGW
jgi:hypothetical protein